MTLNPHQQMAVQHVEGPLLVLAGAGSGKTRVVTHRIAHLLEIGVLPSDILAVTFTNKAAEEMKSRIRILKNAQVLACTFHSLGARILRESIHLLGYDNNFVIYDQEDSEKLLKACMQQLSLGEDRGTLRTLKSQISIAKNNLATEEESETNHHLFAQVFALYQKKLKECNALDFDDLLYLPVKLLKECEEARLIYQKRWTFLLIDEYQDTNAAQYTLARILVEKHRNLFAVGDPDQSIYSWRGAQYQNILRFEKDFPGAKVVTLEENYRSTNRILEAANALISHNASRYEKNLWSQLGEGEKIGLFMAQSERQEAEFVVDQILQRVTKHHLSLNDIAIFYRTNAQSRIFEDALLSKKISYTIIGGLSFYQRKEIKDILAYLRMIVSDADLISFLRTVNMPKRGLGASTLEKIVEAAGTQPIFTFCEEILSSSSSLLSLSAKQKNGLTSYVQLIRKLRQARPDSHVHQLIQKTIEESNYLHYLQEDPESYQDRKENVNELIGKAAEWEDQQERPALVHFLEELSLRTNAEEQTDLSSIKLMTLHNSKGLEFPLVFLVGLEEELLPHANALSEPTQLEEERRLCYVGMTRAKRFLYLCAASYRYLWGSPRLMRKSRFIKEIPSKYLHYFQENVAIFERSEEPSTDPEGFSLGDSVLHTEFGKGIIRKAYHSSFGLTYDVHFPNSDTNRTLVAKFAKLRLCQE